MVQILPSKPLVQRPDVLVSIGCVQGPKGKNLGRFYVDGQAKATRDDPEEETIKTEIEAEGQQQQPMGLAQHESIIAPPMAKKPKSSLPPVGGLSAQENQGSKVLDNFEFVDVESLKNVKNERPNLI